MDNVQGVHGFSELLPWTQWDSLDNVQGHSGKSPLSPWTKSRETSWTGQCPETKSRESMDKVQGLGGQSGLCLLTFWTKSRESRQTGQQRYPSVAFLQNFVKVHTKNAEQLICKSPVNENISKWFGLYSNRN